MTRLHAVMGSLTLLGLAACDQPEQLVPPPVEGSGAACVAEDVEAWVGQDVGLFDPMPGLVVRIARPGDALTQDYRADRVTFLVDENGTILRATCG